MAMVTAIILVYGAMLNSKSGTAQGSPEEILLPARIIHENSTGERTWKLLAEEGELVAIFLVRFRVYGSCEENYLDISDWSEKGSSKLIRICGDIFRSPSNRPIYTSNHQALVKLSISTSAYSRPVELVAVRQARPFVVEGWLNAGYHRKIHTVGQNTEVFIDPKLRIPTNGTITTWIFKSSSSIYPDDVDNFWFAVFRPEPIPFTVLNSDKKSFVVIGQSQPDFNVISLADKESLYEIPENGHIDVEVGDYLGFISTGGKIPIIVEDLQIEPYLLHYNSSVPKGDRLPLDGSSNVYNVSGTPGKLSRVFHFGARLKQDERCLLRHRESDCPGTLVDERCGLTVAPFGEHFCFWSVPALYTTVITTWRRGDNIVVKAVLSCRKQIDGQRQLKVLTATNSFGSTNQLADEDEDVAYVRDIHLYLYPGHQSPLFTVKHCRCFCKLRSSKGEISVPFSDETTSPVCSYSIYQLKLPGRVSLRYYFILTIEHGVTLDFNSGCIGYVHILETSNGFTRPRKTLCFDGHSVERVHVIASTGASLEVQTSRTAEDFTLNGDLTLVENATDFLRSGEAPVLLNTSVLVGYQAFRFQDKDCGEEMYLTTSNFTRGPTARTFTTELRPQTVESDCRFVYRINNRLQFRASVDVQYKTENHCLDYMEITSQNNELFFNSCKAANNNSDGFSETLTMETDYLLIRLVSDAYKVDVIFNLTLTLTNQILYTRLTDQSGAIFSNDYPQIVDVEYRTHKFLLSPSGANYIIFYIHDLVNEDMLTMNISAVNGFDRMITYSSDSLPHSPKSFTVNGSSCSLEITFWGMCRYFLTYHTDYAWTACQHRPLYITSSKLGYCYGPVPTNESVTYKGWLKDTRATCHGNEIATITYQEEHQFITRNFLAREKNPYVIRRSKHRHFHNFLSIPRYSEDECLTMDEDFIWNSTSCQSDGEWTPICQEDVDECETKPEICETTEDCYNIKGSYRCVCKNGYFSDLSTCRDICAYEDADWEVMHEHCVHRLNSTDPFNITCDHRSILSYLQDTTFYPVNVSTNCSNTVNNSVDCSATILDNRLFCVRGVVSFGLPGSKLTSPYGRLSSPRYPEMNTLLIPLVWRISLSTHQAVRLEVLEVLNTRCEIFDSNQTTPKDQLMELDLRFRENTSYVLVSSGPHLTVRIHPYHRLMEYRLMMIYNPAECGLGGYCENGSGCRSKGVLETPGSVEVPSRSAFPSILSVCRWHITATSGVAVDLNMDCTQASGRHFGRVRVDVYDGMESSAEKQIIRSEDNRGDNCPLVISESSSLTVVLTVGNSEVSLLMEYNDTDCAGCGVGSLRKTGTFRCYGKKCGYITSPFYPYAQQYTQIDLSWHITASNKHFVTLKFETFETNNTDQDVNRVTVSESMDPDVTPYTVRSTTRPREGYDGNEIFVRMISGLAILFKAKYNENKFRGDEIDGGEAYSNQSQEGGNCPVGWKPYGNHCYLYNKAESIGWKTALERCRKYEDSDLVSILDRPEMEFVFSYIIENATVRDMLYIGLEDKNKTNQFRWSDGNPACFFAWPRPQGDKHRYPATDNVNGCMKFVYLNSYSFKQWREITCAAKVVNSYICKKASRDGAKVIQNLTLNYTHSGCMRGFAVAKSGCYRLASIDAERFDELDKVCGTNSYRVSNISVQKLSSLFRDTEKRFISDVSSEANYLLDDVKQNYTNCTIFGNITGSVTRSTKLCKELKPNIVVLCWQKHISGVEIQDGTNDSLSSSAKQSKTTGTVEQTERQGLLTASITTSQVNRTNESSRSISGKTGNMFRCTNGEYVLITDACDNGDGAGCRDGSTKTDCNVVLKSWFRCNDGRLIPPHHFCDFQPHCTNGEDEQCEYIPCTPDEFRCSSGQCIKLEKECDSHSDCYDGSDEENCGATDHNGFMCSDGTLIAKTRECNGQVDCPGYLMEDERREKLGEDPCDYLSGCPPDKFQCMNDFCADRASLCIYEMDESMAAVGCQDMSHLRRCEDFVCPHGYVKCANSYCIPIRYVCNEIVDCPYSTDERNCSDYMCQGEFRCRHSNTCVSLSYDRCNNVIDCPHGDDEELCDFPCPNGCTCEGGMTDCSGLNLTSVPENLNFHTRALDLSNNSLSDLTNATDRILPHLFFLNLSYNDFSGWTKGFFFPRLQQIVLEKLGKIGNIRGQMFQTLYLTSLDLQDLDINRIHDDAFKGLENLTELNIKGNPIQHFSNVIFDPLKSLKVLNADKYVFCCLLDRNVNCTPPKDALSSCKDLVGHVVYRVFLWLFGLMALLGNVGVVIWRWVREETNQVHALMIGNLAVADGLMGLYMITIASADEYYRGTYIEHSESWLFSPLCTASGVMATVSSQVSVLTLTLITLDRFICIVFPLRLQRIRLCTAKKMIAGVWVLVIILALIPVIPSHYFQNKFYGKSGVCLPLPLTGGQPPGWEYSTALFIVLNAASCLLMFLGYVIMYWVVRKSHRATQETLGRSHTKREMAIARRMSLIVSTDLVCWLPIIITGLLSLSNKTSLDAEVYVVMAVFVLPVNSAINPILYTYSTINIGRLRKSSSASKSPDQSAKPMSMTSVDDLSQKSGIGNSTATSKTSMESCLNQSKELSENRIVTLDMTRVVSLTKCLEDQWELSSDHILTIYRDVSAALAYLHSLNICHCAVCPDNILLYRDLVAGDTRAFLAGTKSMTQVGEITKDIKTSEDVTDLTNVIDMIMRQQGIDKGGVEK